MCVCGVYTNETIFPWSTSYLYCVPATPSYLLCFFGWGSFSYFLKTALLRYNSHNTIQFFHLKCTIQWILVIYRVVKLSPHPILDRFHRLKKNLCPH